jgi:hypothetical protein
MGGVPVAVPVVKKAPDPGFATLVWTNFGLFYDL